MAQVVRLPEPDPFAPGLDLAAIARRKRISVQVLARQANVPYWRLGRVFRGEVPATADEVARLAVALLMPSQDQDPAA